LIDVKFLLGVFAKIRMQSARPACHLGQKCLKSLAAAGVSSYLQKISAKNPPPRNSVFVILVAVKPIDLERLVLPNKKGNKNEKSI
jgi:hypothetical protein